MTKIPPFLTSVHLRKIVFIYLKRTREPLFQLIPDRVRYPQAILTTAALHPPGQVVWNVEGPSVPFWCRSFRPFRRGSLRRYCRRIPRPAFLALPPLVDRFRGKSRRGALADVCGFGHKVRITPSSMRPWI